MPMALLMAHARMLPRLDAQDMLDRISSTAAGFGSMKDGDAYVRKLREIAYGKRKPQYDSLKGLAKDLQVMGIAVARKARG